MLPAVTGIIRTKGGIVLVVLRFAAASFNGLPPATSLQRRKVGHRRIDAPAEPDPPGDWRLRRYPSRPNLPARLAATLSRGSPAASRRMTAAPLRPIRARGGCAAVTPVAACAARRPGRSSASFRRAKVTNHHATSIAMGAMAQSPGEFSVGHVEGLPIHRLSPISRAML